MNTKKHATAIAFSIFAALASVSSIAYGQDERNSLIGVWQVSAAATVDCQTGLPDGSPPVRVNYSFNQGGTMTEEEANPFDGPYRASAQGIWKRISGRNYTALYTNFAFNADRTLALTVKQKTNITLGDDPNSFTERGTFELFLPDGTLFFSGCFSDSAARLTF
jgi:hypothetical protein